MIMTYGPATTYRSGQFPRQRQTTALKAVNQPAKVKRERQPKRPAVILLTLLLVTFLAGIVLGNKSGHAAADHNPPADIVAQLHWAQTHSKTPCWAEWSATTTTTPGTAAKIGDTGPAGWDVVCSPASR